MFDTFLILFIGLGVPAYLMWRRYEASIALISSMDDLDSFLGNKEIDETLKDVAYQAYDDSLKFLAPYYFAWSLTGYSNSKSKKADALLDSMATDEHLEKFRKILSSQMIVSLKLSPITYFLVILLFGSWALMRSMLTGQEVNLSKIFEADQVLHHR